MAGGQLGSLMRFVRRLVHAPTGAEPSDRQLLEQFAGQRDEGAFAELVARHGPMVYNVCRRVLDDSHAAEDAFQAAFLVLARKSASLNWHESVGNWLHETAFRTATKAKADAARRRAREQQAPAGPRSDAMPDVDWRELRAVLDQELNCLPAKYRGPLVLCYLEGRTNEEAAQLLGWTKGTVSGRLARARDMLRDRLRRRGLWLTVAALGTLLAQNVLNASVPPGLTESAVRCAVLFTSGSAAAGSIAAPVTQLTEGVLQAMLLHRLKIALGLILLLGAAGAGMGLLTYRFFSQEAAAVPIGETKPQPPPSGKEVNGLKLSLQASPTETAMKADGSNAVPVKLKLIVTNVSDKPIKLDAYLLTARHLKATVVPPDDKSVRVQQVLAGVKPQPPVTADFRTIEPGKGWTVETDWSFPGYLPIKDFGGNGYTVLKPGDFRIQFSYENPQELKDPLAAGSWTGTLISNEVILKIKPAGAAD